jgi:hypothetical protein
MCLFRPFHYIFLMRFSCYYEEQYALYHYCLPTNYTCFKTQCAWKRAAL